MWKPWRNKEPEVVEMTESEKSLILRFAKGEEECRLWAIDIHRRYISTLCVRGTIEQNFMAEVDNPVPDLLLRRAYRTALIQYHESLKETY